MFYLGGGATWGVNFTGCGLPRLVCFSESYFAVLRFTYVLSVPGYMLRPKKIYLG